MKLRVSSCRPGVVLGIAVVVVASVRVEAAPSEPSALFNARCSSCHTYGKGDKVGPDLKGVTERHSRSWLLNWIRSSERMVRAADPTAAALFQKYRRQRMPDFDLGPQRIGALVDYLAAGGPEADAPPMRAASTATADEVRLGQALFEGRVSLASGAVACMSCHTVAGGGALGGSLGPDLSGAFPRYRDRGLHQFLQRACFPRGPAGERPALTENESLALRAFLRTSVPQVQVSTTGGDAADARAVR